MLPHLFQIFHHAMQSQYQLAPSSLLSILAEPIYARGSPVSLTTSSPPWPLCSHRSATALHREDTTEEVPELRVEFRGAAGDVQSAHSAPAGCQQLQAGLCSGPVHGLLTQGRALHMAMRARLVAVKPDVELQRRCWVPPQRPRPMLLATHSRQALVLHRVDSAGHAV